MRERLIENWLDRINERGYQPVFCQALSAQGYTVLHSTRHGPMELGKDVIARDPDGIIHAFQLKGNPGGRLTIGNWNADILPQIHALMLQPVEPPLTPTAVLALPYLVTNGEVDEEVHAAIRGVNAARPSGHELRLIARGELLATYIGPIANELWPNTIDIDRHILECWNVDGKGFLPAERYHNVIIDALPFDAPPATTKPLVRAIFAAAVVHELCLRRFSEAHNYVSLLLGRAQFLAAAYSLAAKANLADKELAGLQNIYWSAMRDDIRGLISDLERSEPRYFYEGPAHLQFTYHKPRLLLLASILSLVVLASYNGHAAFSDSGDIDRANSLIGKIDPRAASAIFGEYVVPQILFIYWRSCLTSGRIDSDYFIASVLGALLNENAKEDRALHIPDPYQLMPEVMEGLIDRFAPRRAVFERRPSYRHKLWTAMALFGILVRRNLKSTAANVFPELSKFIHRSTVLTNAWEFGLFRATDAADHGERLTIPGQWGSYIERTRIREPSLFPSALASDLLTLGFFLILCPFRTNEEIVYYVDEMLIGNWHPSQ